MASPRKRQIYREKVSRAQNAINREASYAPAVGYDDLGACYAPEAHSVEGFFKNGQIVCDGYASVFQYLMLRSGVDCVVALGSTVSAEDAENGMTNHAWNKVKVNGVWRNEDVCWSDTGYPYLYDLRDDAFYARHRHWAVPVAVIPARCPLACPPVSADAPARHGRR